MLAVTGYRSKIVEELRKLLPPGEEVVEIMAVDEPPLFDRCDRYLFCAGLLQPKRVHEQTADEIEASLYVNAVVPMRACNAILTQNDRARICVIGSESGFSWSYDDVYAASKAALHRYVETKKLKPDQQLVCVAPSIISDAQMTLRRTDLDNLQKRLDRNPKKRFLLSAEVAQMIYHLLYVDSGYTTGVVIRMNGGEHTLGA